MGLGDELLAAGHAYRTFREGDGRRVAICDKHWRTRWHPLWDGLSFLAPPGATADGESVIFIQNGSGCRPYIQYPFTVDTGWRWTGWRARDHRGKIVFTREERDIACAMRVEGPYVVLEPSIKAGTTVNKDWGIDRYQAVVDAFPGVRFVRPMFNDARPMRGVQALEGLTTRTLAAIIEKADLYIGTEGFCHHVAAMCGVPAVVVFGGAIDPEITGYPEQVNLAAADPCGSHRPCAHCRAWLDALTPQQVVECAQPLLKRWRRA